MARTDSLTFILMAQDAFHPLHFTLLHVRAMPLLGVAQSVFWNGNYIIKNNFIWLKTNIVIK